MFTTEKAPGEIQNPSFRENDSELDDASKLLLKAAALIEEVGHAQHTLCDNDGRMCIGGAISFVDTGVKGFSGSFYRTGIGTEALRRMNDALVDLVNWNNTRGRTQAEVVAKLRAVALGTV